MYNDAVAEYARQRGIPPRDAAQTLLQIIALRHLVLPKARFMGGSALVLGYSNPRFSEDVDLTQVEDPALLKPGLSKAAEEIGRWLSCPVSLMPPKAGGRTWRLTCRLGRAESLALHVDGQPYRSYTTHPVVFQFPSIPAFVVEAMSVTEIMSEKVIALAYRRYLGGRDLFDLWFHWLRLDDRETRRGEVVELVEKKMKERGLSLSDLDSRLKERLTSHPALGRAREEWKRYLPRDFQKEGILNDVVASCQRLPSELFP